MLTTTTRMECQRIRDITQRQAPRTIEVRVLRKWISKGKKEALCYLLVDAYGDCIESVAEVKHIEHFDSMIRLQSCYKISDYICTGPRTYMATVDHAASLVFGRKARFDEVTNPNIPTVYFSFATYETIKTRIKDTRLLTASKREFEITLWPEKCHLIGDDVVPGHIVAISSTMVTEHSGLLQLESTYLTIVVVNPDMPQTIEHVHRLRELPPMTPTETHDQKVTIQDLKRSSQQNIEFQELPDDDIIPIFRYSVNATIVDETGSAEAIFFNESMEALLNISCKEMVTKHADTTNTKIVPHQLRSAIDKQSLLYLTLKNDGKIAINNASKVASTTSCQSTNNLLGTSTFTPNNTSSKISHIEETACRITR
ncbi:hypothetical protein CASFOL_000062 [Castilleja foliolosa]|uniref:Uncharacterized protein n=1 Tax=Castilleja foliolosa TaxID=1961234 RepID=A0ABD3ENA2_9LAMI